MWLTQSTTFAIQEVEDEFFAVFERVSLFFFLRDVLDSTLAFVIQIFLLQKRQDNTILIKNLKGFG